MRVVYQSNMINLIKIMTTKGEKSKGRSLGKTLRIGFKVKFEI